MSSDLFLLDDSFFRHSSNNSDMGISIPPDFNLPHFLSSEPIFPFDHDSPSDQFLQSNNLLIDPNPLQFPTDPSPIVTNPFFSSSPPSKEFNNLSLGNENPTDQLHSLVPTSAIFGDGGISSDLIKPEDCYIGFDYTSSQVHPLLPIDDFSSNTEKLMQRSFSSHSLDQKPGFFFQPHLDSVLEAPNFSTQIMGSPENSIFNGAMRRVCSTGDLQRFKRTHSSHGFSSSPLAAENNSLLEEVTLKARPYNAEERKQRIHRYRSKRTQRNFNKTIKYACRKTLADSRPRVRGRFARNDETGEIPKVTGFNREEDDEDELWFYEDVEGGLGGGRRGGGEVFDQRFINNIRNENQYFGSSSSSSSYVGSCSFSWKGLSSSAKVFSSDL